jgi:ketosteroid isomerase-like protein
MSQENVEIVRRAYSAGFRRPKPDYGTVNELFDPDHELLSFISSVEGRRFRGALGFREWLSDMDQAWESWEAKWERTTDVDEERVLAVMEVKTHSRMAGIPLKRDIFFISTVREGQVVRTESYPGLAEAIEAAGLSE